MSNKNKYFAEFIGTLLLVLMGTGSAVLAGDYIGFAGVAFAFGLTLMAMVYVIGPVSGCHINPAITLAMCSTGKIEARPAFFYIIAQLLGAAAGSLLVYVIASGISLDSSVFTLASNGYGALSPDGYSLLAGLTAEITLTAMFLFVICGVVSRTDNTAFAGLAIGLTLTVILLVGIPVTNGSFNPARAFGPSFILGALKGNWAYFAQWWAFIVGPVAGALIGAFAWKAVSAKSEKPKKK